MMGTVTVQIGSVVAGNSGQTNDSRCDVTFEAEELSRRTQYGQDRNGGISDSRGVTETLYRCADGRLVVHVGDWSYWQNESNVYTLREVTEADLQPGGEFEQLGCEAGMGRPLTLDEALTA